VAADSLLLSARLQRIEDKLDAAVPSITVAAAAITAAVAELKRLLG